MPQHDTLLLFDSLFAFAFLIFCSFAVAISAPHAFFRACWSMGDWGSFEQFVEFTDDTLPEGAYLRAVVAVRKDDLDLCAR